MLKIKILASLAIGLLMTAEILPAQAVVSPSSHTDSTVGLSTTTTVASRAGRRRVRYHKAGMGRGGWGHSAPAPRAGMGRGGWGHSAPAPRARRGRGGWEHSAPAPAAGGSNCSVGRSGMVCR